MEGRRDQVNIERESSMFMSLCSIHYSYLVHVPSSFFRKPLAIDMHLTLDFWEGFGNLYFLLPPEV